MKKLFIIASIIAIGSFCYAKNPSLGTQTDNPSDRTRISRVMACPEWFAKWENKDIMDARKKLFELKKFKWETIKENLKIESSELASIINQKISNLKLSNKTFDSLRKKAKNDRERICINRLENKFLKFQMMVKFIGEGCPKIQEWKKRQAETQIEE